MIDFPNLATVSLAFLLVTASPGPANIAVATVAMGSGRASGLRFGAGLSVGLAVWGLAAATGLGALLQGSAHLLTALKIAGGLYLLWLAFTSGRSALRPRVGDEARPRQDSLFRRGLVLNLSNPKAVVAWMAALSMGLGDSHGALQLAAATGVCVLIGFLNYAGHAMAFSLSGVMAAYARLRRWIDGVVASLFAIAGIGLIRSALSR
jgi:threonine efflux protein